MDVDNDPNAPDCTNGDFFCRLCLASMNSETMWSSHIAGKRHIKNVQKYPNGLPKRRMSDDEDSYDRPPKHERLDSNYDWRDGYPPDYDGYYEDEFYKKRPPADYVPILKPNVVFDYGHTKKLEDDIPPPLPSPPVPLPVVPKLAPVLLEPKKEETMSTSMKLDEILNNITADSMKSQVHDDFFEKINQREIAKDIAKELAQKCVFSNKINVKKDPQIQSSSSVCEKYSQSSDIFDILHKHNEKKLFSEIDEDDSKTKDSPSRKSPRSRNSSPPKKSSLTRDSTPPKKSSLTRVSSPPPKKSSYIRDSSPPPKKSSYTRDSPPPKKSSYRDSSPPKKSSRTRNSSPHKKSSYTRNSSPPKKTSHIRSSSPEKSLGRRKEKSDLNNFDPDELTPDMLDDLLSVHLKSKVTNSDKSQECVKHSEEDKAKQLDDPEVLAEKLNTLPTMKVLEIFHKKLKNLDLKDSAELKMVLEILTAAQELVCKKLPPNLQAVLNAKMSGSDVKNTSVPSQNALKSGNSTSASVTLSSKGTRVSQNYPTVAPQPQAPTVPAAPPIRTVVSQRQTVIPGLSQSAAIRGPSNLQSAVTSQNQLAASVAALITSTAPSQNHTAPSQSTASLLSHFASPRVPTSPGSFPMPPALMNPIQAATNQHPVAAGVSNPMASQAAWQNYQMYNYFRMMQYMYANRQAAPSNTNSVPSTSQLPASKQTEQPNAKSTEQSNAKSSEQSKDKSTEYSKSRSSEYSKDKSSDYSKSKSSEYSKSRSSEYSKDKSSDYSKSKSSEYSKSKSSEYSKDKSSENSKSKYSDYSKNKHSDYSNSNLSEHSRSAQPEQSKINQLQYSKSSQPNQPPVAFNAQSLQASKDLLETLKKLQELSEEYKKSTSAKKTKK